MLNYTHYMTFLGMIQGRSSLMVKNGVFHLNLWGEGQVLRTFMEYGW